VLANGQDALVPIHFLDGRKCVGILSAVGTGIPAAILYDALQKEPEWNGDGKRRRLAAHERQFSEINCAGSWINANFNVWIGAPEDNKAWDYLYQARIPTLSGPGATKSSASWRLKILIAEGATGTGGWSEHHLRVNDRDFDELYANTVRILYGARWNASGLSGAADQWRASRPLLRRRRLTFIRGCGRHGALL